MMPDHATSHEDSDGNTGFQSANAGPDRQEAGPTSTIPVRSFDERYSTGKPRWDTDRPQPAFVALEEAGVITGKVLDAGCGTGEIALFLAQKGYDVLGVDASSVAISQAEAKAQRRGLTARFLAWDALDLPSLGETFDTAVDSGLLYVFSDADRARLVDKLHAVLRPGGRYHLLCFSEHATQPASALLIPRRLTQADLRASFSHGWEVEGITLSPFDRGGARLAADAWLATIRRLPGAQGETA